MPRFECVRSLTRANQSVAPQNQPQQSPQYRWSLTPDGFRAELALGLARIQGAIRRRTKPHQKFSLVNGCPVRHLRQISDQQIWGVPADRVDRFPPSSANQCLTQPKLSVTAWIGVGGATAQPEGERQGEEAHVSHRRSFFISGFLIFQFLSLDGAVNFGVADLRYEG